MKAVISIFFWVFGAVMTALMCLAAASLYVYSCLFDKKRKLSHALCFWWSDAIIKMNPFWHLSVKGLENIDPKKTYVVIANHESLADIIIVYKTRLQFKWMAKASLFKVPVLGWNLSLIKHIRVSRNDLGSIKKAYIEAGNWLKKGISVLFFPEGTRSLTGHIGDFKNGAFKLAIKEGKPILPIYLEGSREVIPRGSWVFKSDAYCKLKVLEPIETDGLEPNEYAKLRDRVRERLIAASKEE